MNLIRFAVAGRDYGIDVSQAYEVIQMTEVTPVPNATDFVKGVIDLRGRVVPLVSLRERFGLEILDADDSCRIIVGNFSGKTVGIIVDQVKDVVSLEEDHVEPPDSLLNDAKYLSGVGKAEDNLILILDLEKLLSVEDQADIVEIVES